MSTSLRAHVADNRLAVATSLALALLALQYIVVQASPAGLAVRIVLPATMALAPLALWPLRRHAGVWVIFVGLGANLAAVLANGGYLTESYYIDRVENAAGEVVFEADPLLACAACTPPVEAVSSPLLAATQPQELPPPPPDCEPAPGWLWQQDTGRLAPSTISPQNAYLIADMMRDVITRGTGRRASPRRQERAEARRRRRYRRGGARRGAAARGDRPHARRIDGHRRGARGSRPADPRRGVRGARWPGKTPWTSRWRS